jgi:protein-S-isoprenylcysteine O-methyltransferase Ste14
MNTENFYRFTALALILLGASISIYYRSKANSRGGKVSEQEEGDLILNLRRVFGLVLWVSTLLYLINPSWMSWSSLPLPTWLRWIGAGAMLVCVPLIYWVFSSLGKNVTPTVVVREQANLVTSGPYRWVRHPLYTVGALMFLGLSLLAANWFFPLILAVGSSVLNARTKIEEKRLIDAFGDEYRAYMQQTGRYLPRLDRLLGSKSG